MNSGQGLRRVAEQLRFESLILLNRPADQLCKLRITAFEVFHLERLTVAACSSDFSAALLLW
jgi:hypothetical protein